MASSDPRFPKYHKKKASFGDTSASAPAWPVFPPPPRPQRPDVLMTLALPEKLLFSASITTTERSSRGTGLTALLGQSENLVFSPLCRVLASRFLLHSCGFLQSIRAFSEAFHVLIVCSWTQESRGY